MGESGSSSYTKPTPSKLAELLALARARKAQLEVNPTQSQEISYNARISNSNVPKLDDSAKTDMGSSDNTPTNGEQATDRFGKEITYNAAQLAFINLATQGRDCILLGAAGTGKTTSQKGVIQSLLQSGAIPAFPADMVHKSLKPETPGIVITSFTRRAVSNIKRNVSADLASNCITIHKLLEYQPEYYEVMDEESGDWKKTMRFAPARSATNPLPPEIAVIIFEESSMVSAELFNLVQDACPHKPQYIFLGDIQQLPPTFGTAILGYKMLELEDATVELTEVYRQALDSPIIRLAHRILSGRPIPASDYSTFAEGSPNLIIHPWKKKLKEDVACLTAAAFLKQALDTGLYNPEEDMILCPFNKAFGTIEINKHLAQHLARKSGLSVYEIIAGYNKHYFSVGDKILYDKEDGKILKIEKNSMYLGKRPTPASKTLDYWGHEHDYTGTGGSTSSADDLGINIDAILAMAAGEAEDKVNHASHKVTVWLNDSEREIELDTAAEINNLLLSYSLTVHKSQGSEWRKVFLLFHQSHAVMIQRELLYTAITRAKEELYIICEPETFTGGITSQRIKGDTLAAKAEFFKGKLL